MYFSSLVLSSLLLAGSVLAENKAAIRAFKRFQNSPPVERRQASPETESAYSNEPTSRYLSNATRRMQAQLDICLIYQC